MNEMNHLLPLWRDLREADQDFVLATIVAVEGSGYRKSGARMIVASDGRRAGTISGGCLEAEVAKKAFWHTENGPVVRRYSTHAEDGDVPYGMGCGGVVHVLLERRISAQPLLSAMTEAYDYRQPMAVATFVGGTKLGQRLFSTATPEPDDDLSKAIHDALSLRQTALLSATQRAVQFSDFAESIFAEWIAPRPGLFVVGAGNDAQPLVRMARELGWYIAVMDGRSHLATRERFPEADAVFRITPDSLATLDLRATDAVALMTHSLEQDKMALRAMLPHKPAYLGVLGPRQRTADMLHELAIESEDNPTQAERTANLRLESLYAPMGLDLGGDGPAPIALAIIAEIQQTLTQHTGRALRELKITVAPPPAMVESLKK
uniref:Putative Xanthine dehydrogenase accessory factor n=1 Tax=mine drainage metagenome TaxID=410659 RepID=E6QIV5_9ZZZZ